MDLAVLKRSGWLGMPLVYMAKTLNERDEKQFELCDALALDLPFLERESEHNLSATPELPFEWLGVVGTFKESPEVPRLSYFSPNDGKTPSEAFWRTTIGTNKSG
jgi:hypothetical protein